MKRNLRLSSIRRLPVVQSKSLSKTSMCQKYNVRNLVNQSISKKDYCRGKQWSQHKAKKGATYCHRCWSGQSCVFMIPAVACEESSCQQSTDRLKINFFSNLHIKMEPAKFEMKFKANRSRGWLRRFAEQHRIISGYTRKYSLLIFWLSNLLDDICVS